MKITKLLAAALTATLLCGSVNVNAYAAETTTTAEIVTEVESTEESTNEDTEAVEAGEEETTSNIEGTSEEVTEAAEETEKVDEEAEETTEEATEESKKEETKEKEKEEEKKATVEKSSTKKTKKASYTKSELRLLSSLIYCEAGSEPYAGKLGVAIVVMNRVESKAFPNTLKGVIYQKYQFGPARNGSLSRAVSNYDAGKFATANHKACIKAAKAALEGIKTIDYKGKEINMKNMLYFSGRVSGAKLTIANHQFK